MIRVTHWILTSLMILLGIVHSLMAFRCRDLDVNMLWFLGAGIAIVFAGLFNVLFLSVNSSTVKVVTVVVNVLMTGLFIFALKVMFTVQVYVGISLFAVAAILTFFDKENYNLNHRRVK